MSLHKTYVKSKNCYKVTFSLRAEENPEKSKVRVLGDFNAWSEDLAPVMRLNKGIYQTTIELPVNTEFQFRYKIGAHDWLNDDGADRYVASPHVHVDNCVLLLGDGPKAAVTKSAEVAKKAPVVKSAKKTKSEAPPKVNFTKIEGIGPKISQLLIDAGILTYEELAGMKKKAIRVILDNAGKRYAMHDPTTWPKQSKLLAQGKLKELKTLQEELKGGKKK